MVKTQRVETMMWELNIKSPHPVKESERKRICDRVVGGSQVEGLPDGGAGVVRNSERGEESWREGGREGGSASDEGNEL